MDASLDVARPRNLDWKRAAALLYGDWGTSKAYVIGFAFLAMHFASLPTILAVCALTGLVGINYAIICRYFPDGGGVYSSARGHGKALAVLGALLLVADLAVTAALSGYEAIKYFAPNLPNSWVPWITMLVIMAFGLLNSYGPRHSGALAVALAIPMVIMVVGIIALSIPYLTTNLPAPKSEHAGAVHAWHAFVAAILALSGVEAIAGLTGVMKVDKDSPPGKPKVARECAKAILPVAIEVVIGTALLGWAMVSLFSWSHSVFEPHHTMEARLEHDYSHMLRVLGEEYGAKAFGHHGGLVLGITVGIIVGLLLTSAVNTAVASLIGILYTLARDGQLPRSFLNLNRFGVPKIPLVLAVILPCLVLAVTSLNPDKALNSLAALYAIGVVGAVAVNLGSCTFNRSLPLKRWERAIFAVTFFILFCVEVTLAYDKHEALFFVVMVLGFGFWLRSMTHKSIGMATVTIAKEMAETVTPEAIARMRPAPLTEGSKMLVSARGLTPVLKYALKEAKLHNAVLCVLYVKEIAILLGGEPRSDLGRKPKWQDDPQASAIMTLMLKLGEETDVCVQPIYAVSTDPATTIVDVAATLGADLVMLGSAHRSNLARLLKGNVVEQVARALPEDIELVIHG